MGNLLSKIETDLNDAMKDGNKIVVDTLRMVRAALKNHEIDLRTQKKELDDNEVIGILRHEIKKREEAIEFFKKGNRNDLVEKEQSELGVIRAYLPQELSDEEIEKIIAEALAKNPSLKNNFGLLTKEAMTRIAGKASGGRVAGIIKKSVTSNQ